MIDIDKIEEAAKRHGSDADWQGAAIAYQTHVTPSDVLELVGLIRSQEVALKISHEKFDAEAARFKAMSDYAEQLKSELAAIPAKAGIVNITAAERSCVINWLEGGRDPKDAAKELRLYCERAWIGAQPVERLPKWIDDQKGSDPNTDALIEYIEQMRAAQPVQQPAPTPVLSSGGQKPAGFYACPISGREFWGNIEHPERGMIATYGGPFDTYSVPYLDEDDELRVERFDQDRGDWVEGGEPFGWFYREQQPEYPAPVAAPVAGQYTEQLLCDYLLREMPSGTVIGDPTWWAQRIAKAIHGFTASGRDAALVKALKDIAEACNCCGDRHDLAQIAQDALDAHIGDYELTKETQFKIMNHRLKKIFAAHPANVAQVEHTTLVPEHHDRVVWKGNYYHLPTTSSFEETVIEKRIAITPEYEGGFNADIYEGEESPIAKGYGKTPSEAVQVAILAAAKKGGV